MESIVKIFQRNNYSLMYIKEDDINLMLGNKSITKDLFNKYYECSGIYNRNKFFDDNKLRISGELEDEELLEVIFKEMNINRDLYDINYSLSINDIVQIGDKKYQCVSIGWRLLNY